MICSFFYLTQWQDPFHTQKTPYFHSSSQEQTSQDPEKMPATLTQCCTLNSNQSQFSPDINRFPHSWETLYISPSEGTPRVLLWHTQRRFTGPEWTSRAHANTLLSWKQTLIRLPHDNSKNKPPRPPQYTQSKEVNGTSHKVCVPHHLAQNLTLLGSTCWRQKSQAQKVRNSHKPERTRERCFCKQSQPAAPTTERSCVPEAGTPQQDWACKNYQAQQTGHNVCHQCPWRPPYRASSLAPKYTDWIALW